MPHFAIILTLGRSSASSTAYYLYRSCRGGTVHFDWLGHIDRDAQSLLLT